MRAFTALVARDIKLAFRAGGGAAQAVMFFALTVVIFALAAGPDRARLAALATPALWTAATLAAMLSFDRLFQEDYDDGALDAVLETADPLALAVIAKALAHWLSMMLPLIAASPALAILLNLPGAAFWPLTLSLLLGTPALSLLGALASALTLSLRRAAVLMTILTAPILTPVVIFGVASANAGATGDPRYPSTLLILAAFSLFTCVFAPLAAAAAIRFNAD
ncbi:MAG TPA: heme exporter protein CcmB [Parvularcula sp.]|nr:heme exporter protein CcmB [Parvularcula sp.]